MANNRLIRNKKEIHAEYALGSAIELLLKSGTNAPWGVHALMAAALAGWDVVESAWVEDYGGSCGYLLRKAADPTKWATLIWGYGSCSSSDAFDGRPFNEIIADLWTLISEEMTEEVAHKSFEDTVGGFW